MAKTNFGASALAPLLDGSSAGELIPELVRHGLQQLIELEVAAVLGADRHERSEDRLGYRATSTCKSPNCGRAASFPRSSNHAAALIRPSMAW
jgi:hypothetical protein